eukprot:99095_1
MARFFASFGSDLVLKVPLAVGTLQWGTTWLDHHMMNSKGCITKNEAQNIFNTFSKGGITLWDTAEGYGGGTSESRLGSVSSSHDNALYMTKFLPVPWRYSHKCLENAVRASCKHLNTPYIDIYLLHSPVHWRPIEFWVEACAKCKQLGLINKMGLSNCNAEEVERAVAAGKKYGIEVVCNQVHYSLLTFNSTELQKMEATCRKLDVTIVGYSPIGQGLLTDKATKENWGSNRTAKMLRLQWNDLTNIRMILKELADKYNKSMAQIAINWSICHGVVPLVGCRSVKQAKDSLGATGWMLDKQDVERLDEFALSKSTLESPKLKRMIFVSLFGIVMMSCRMLDYIGYGVVQQAK